MTYTSAILIAAWAVTLGTCLFALGWGNVGERAGAAAIVTGLVFGFALGAVPTAQRAVAELIGDGLIAFAFLLLALKFASRWLGIVLLLYAAQFALHASYFVLSRPHDEFYFVTNDALFFAVTLALLVGAIGAAREKSARRLRPA
jgi:hypothetical protein